MGWVALLGLSSVSALHADKVTLDNWAIDRIEVTIGQFERDVCATGTVTRAENEGGGFEYGRYDMGANVWAWTTDVQAYKPADFYAVYIGLRCAYDVALALPHPAKGQP